MNRQQWCYPRHLVHLLTPAQDPLPVKNQGIGPLLIYLHRPYSKNDLWQLKPKTIPSFKQTNTPASPVYQRAFIRMYLSLSRCNETLHSHTVSGIIRSVKQKNKMLTWCERWSQSIQGRLFSGWEWDGKEEKIYLKKPVPQLLRPVFINQR